MSPSQAEAAPELMRKRPDRGRSLTGKPDTRVFSRANPPSNDAELSACSTLSNNWPDHIVQPFMNHTASFFDAGQHSGESTLSINGDGTAGQELAHRSKPSSMATHLHR